MSAKKRKDGYTDSGKGNKRSIKTGVREESPLIREDDPLEKQDQSVNRETEMMKKTMMFTEQQKTELLNNGQSQNSGKNHIPVAYIEARKIGFSFLITEINPQNTDLVFGLCDYDCDLRFSSFSIKELEKDLEDRKSSLSANLDFLGRHPIAVYAKVAKEVGTIVIDDNDRLLKPLFNNFSSGDLINQSSKIDDLKPL